MEKATVYLTNIHKDVTEKHLQGLVEELRNMNTTFTTEIPRRIRYFSPEIQINIGMLSLLYNYVKLYFVFTDIHICNLYQRGKLGKL